MNKRSLVYMYIVLIAKQLQVVGKHRFWPRTKEFLRDESSRTKEFLSSRCARAGGRGANEVISVRPNKGTAEQRDGRTKRQPNKETATGAGANYPPLPAHANEVLVTSLLC